MSTWVYEDGNKKTEQTTAFNCGLGQVIDLVLLVAHFWYIASYFQERARE
jgi:hypothetical protein